MSDETKPGVPVCEGCSRPIPGAYYRCGGCNEPICGECCHSMDCGSIDVEVDVEHREDALPWPPDLKLKPCPWCGEAGRAYSTHDVDFDTMDLLHWVGCPLETCAVGPSTSMYDSAEEAARVWNERPADD